MDWKGLINFEELPQVTGVALLSKLANEWAALTEKTTPVDADLVLIEDSAAAGAKKKVQISNLGGAPGDQAIVQARRTTTFALGTSYADVTLDTTDVENDSATLDHSTTTDRIVIGETGAYRITWHVDLDQPPTGSTQNVSGRVRKNDTTVLPGSSATTTVFEDSSIAGSNMDNDLGTSFVTTLTAGDFVTLQLQRTEVGGTGAFSTKVGIVLTVTRLSGQQGAQGIPGSGTSITVKDEGTNVANTPHTALNFAGSGVAATDGGAGVATVTIPGFQQSYGESEGVSTTNTSTWVQKLRVSITPSTTGKFLVLWQASISGGDHERFAKVRVQQNDTTDLIDQDVEVPKGLDVTNRYVAWSGFKQVTLTGSTAYNFDLDFAEADSQATNVAYIKNARIIVRRMED